MLVLTGVCDHCGCNYLVMNCCFGGEGKNYTCKKTLFLRLFFFFSEEGRSMKEKCMFALHNAVNAINMACRNMACRTIFCMLY